MFSIQIRSGSEPEIQDCLHTLPGTDKLTFSTEFFKVTANEKLTFSRRKCIPLACNIMQNMYVNKLLKRKGFHVLPTLIDTLAGKIWM